MTRAAHSLKDRMYTLIFTNETAAGRLFDKTLIALILLSLVIVVLDSVEQAFVAHDLAKPWKW